VCATTGVAAAVLLRALEPVENLAGRTQGPGLLCRAMGINKTRYGCDLLGEELFIEAAASPPPFKIVRTPRIGVDYAGAWAKRLLRFYVEGNPFVSGRRKQ
jgi:DNA-3-methyladenine glycosylase